MKKYQKSCNLLQCIVILPTVNDPNVKNYKCSAEHYFQEKMEAHSVRIKTKEWH